MKNDMTKEDLFQVLAETFLDDNFQIVIDEILESPIEVQIEFIRGLILEPIGDDFSKITKIKGLIPAASTVFGEYIDVLADSVAEIIENIDGPGIDRLNKLFAVGQAKQAKIRSVAFMEQGFTKEEALALTCAYVGNNPFASLAKKR
jgi:hypothetical protein